MSYDIGIWSYQYVNNHCLLNRKVATIHIPQWTAYPEIWNIECIHRHHSQNVIHKLQNSLNDLEKLIPSINTQKHERLCGGKYLDELQCPHQKLALIKIHLRTIRDRGLAYPDQ